MCPLSVTTAPHAEGATTPPISSLIASSLVSACLGAVRFDPPLESEAADTTCRRTCWRRTDTDPQTAGEPIQIYDVDFRSESGSLTGVSDSPAARLAPRAR